MEFGFQIVSHFICRALLITYKHQMPPKKFLKMKCRHLKHKNHFTYISHSFWKRPSHNKFLIHTFLCMNKNSKLFLLLATVDWKVLAIRKWVEKSMSNFAYVIKYSLNIGIHWCCCCRQQQSFKEITTNDKFSSMIHALRMNDCLQNQWLRNTSIRAEMLKHWLSLSPLLLCETFWLRM